ncbi:hypothetical protein PNP85_09150 [Halobacterium salinarum]|nr:hypothetical protein [Halobacterium salinarum]MDL0128792.1 hypothetical protein [Halobacterium salinarum]MDL0136556.1 hypothetical protein [Halobacterium salinarum]MDL0139670.1 hypothetical protein [Halobacterium salinarum]
MGCIQSLPHKSLELRKRWSGSRINSILGGTDALVEQFRRTNYIDVAEHFETDVYEGYGQLVEDTTS